MGLFGGGNASSSQTNKQNTGTTSGTGSLTLNDSKTGEIHMGNETSIKTQDTYKIQADTNSNNKSTVTAQNGGTINYVTNNGGGDSSGVLDAIGNFFSKIPQSAAASAPQLATAPTVSTAAPQAISSGVKWLLIAAVAIVAFLIFRPAKNK